MTSALALRLDRPALTRWLAAGTAWGLALAAGLIGTTMAQCGIPCPDDVAVTTLTCIGAGLVTLGPVAAFARR